MLTIRLSRQGRTKRPFYRIVLTEHTKPVKFGYKEILGHYDPLAHKLEVNVEQVKSWIAKWAQPSERVAKLILNETKDAFFEKYFVKRERNWKTKNEDKK